MCAGGRPESRRRTRHHAGVLCRVVAAVFRIRSFAPWALGFVRIEVRRFLRKSTRQAQLWLSDGSGIVASCVDGRIRVIDPVKVKVTQDLPAIEGWAYAIAMHPKDQSIAVGGTNGQIRRIELPEVDLASASR